MSAQPKLEMSQTKAMLKGIHDLLNTESRKSFLKAVLNDWSDNKKHNIKIKRGFDTACWAFLNNQHHIYLGDAMFRDVQPSASGESYVHSMVFHELGHSRWTSRNMDKVSALLEKMDLPFGLLNLFEDARIEQKWRDMTDLKFDWELMNKPFEIQSAVQCYFAMIFFEGDMDKIVWDGDIDKVQGFYDRSLAAMNTMEVVYIVADWVEEFGKGVQTPETGMPSSDGGADNDSGKDGGDLQHAVQVAISGSLAELDDDAVTVKVIGQSDDGDDDGNGGGAPEGDGGLTDKQKDNERLIDFDNDLMCSYSRVFDKVGATKTAHMIRKIFLTKAFYKSTHRPSKRINKRIFSGNKDVPMYVRKEAKGMNKVKINLIIDCSGSMSGEPIENAVYIAAVFNQLALKGVVDCKVILSEEDVHPYPNINLPVSDDTIGRIGRLGGGEGLERCFNTHLDEMREADFNFVVTDGHLTDGDIKKSYYQSRGIFTIGMYANPEPRGEDLKRWFDVGIVRRDLSSLFSTLLIKMRSR